MSQDNDKNINGVLNAIINIRAKIKFTCEDKSNNKLNYLYLTIKGSETNFEYMIFQYCNLIDFSHFTLVIGVAVRVRLLIFIIYN